jgi:hypothetical protein
VTPKIALPVFETVAEVREGSERVDIRQNQLGQIACGRKCRGILNDGQCRHVKAFLRARATGRSLIVRDAIGPLMVWLRTDQPTPDSEAYALALELLPREKASVIHAAAERIAAFVELHGGTPRQAPTIRVGKTRKIILVDDI